MSKVIDNIFAARMAVLLYRDWKSWEAYRLGIIDGDGTKLRDPKTPSEESSWTYLHRLATNIKKMIVKVPGGRSMIGKAVAHYALFKESVDVGTSDQELYEQFDLMFWPMVSNPSNDHLITEVRIASPTFAEYNEPL